MENKIKQKVYYKIGEIVEVKSNSELATVKEIDTKERSVSIQYIGYGNYKFDNLKFWEIRKVNPNNYPIVELSNQGLDDTYFNVKQFHAAFNHPVAHTPTFMEPERAAKRISWMEEEIREFKGSTEVVDQADAMIDLIYFAVGTLVELGVRPEPLFKIVQHANMSKLWEDGKPRFKEDGKVMKPLNWVAPESLLLKEIERQSSIQ